MAASLCASYGHCGHTQHHDRHESWFVPPEPTKQHNIAAAAYAQHYDGYFDEPLDYYDDDYASTAAPDSDADDLTDDD